MWAQLYVHILKSTNKSDIRLKKQKQNVRPSVNFHERLNFIILLCKTSENRFQLTHAKLKQTEATIF